MGGGQPVPVVKLPAREPYNFEMRELLAKLPHYPILAVPILAVAVLALFQSSCATGSRWLWVMVVLGAMLLSWGVEKYMKYVVVKFPEAKASWVRTLGMGALASVYVLAGILLVLLHTCPTITLLLLGYGLLDGVLLLKKLP